jgi:hypothetical protein
MPHLQLTDGSRGLFLSKGTFAKPIYVLLSVVGFVLLLAWGFGGKALPGSSPCRRCGTNEAAKRGGILHQKVCKEGN